MQVFIWITIAVMLLTNLSFSNFSGRQVSTAQEKYKMAVDAGTDASAKHITYLTEEQLDSLSYGFGEGLEHSNNITIDRNESLKWFYEVFFRNIGYQGNAAKQAELKKYIPMKAVLGFNSMSIADVNDNWVVIDHPYEVTYNGAVYHLTLSDQIFTPGGDLVNNAIPPSEREKLLNNFISTKLNEFINSNKINSKMNYSLQIGQKSDDAMFSSVDGPSFVVFIEGMPIPAFDIGSGNSKFYGFSMGGAELHREIK